MTNELDITVSDLAGIASHRPVTGGVPLSKGAAPGGSRFRLLQGTGTPIPCQFDILGTWDDGSARWVLLDFQANPPANGKSDYKLVWGGSESQPTPEVPVQIRAGSEFSLESGNLKIRSTKDALFSISDRVAVALTAVDGDGRTCKARAESVAIEKTGELRSTLRIDGSLRTEAGDRFLGFKMWVTTFAGLDKVKLEPMILVDGDKGLVQKLRELKLKILPMRPIDSAVIAGTPDWKGAPNSNVRLFQVDDRQYRIEGADGKGSKSPGWVEAKSGEWRIAAAVRDFWQQWPKSIELDGKSLGIGLFPRFAAGDFDHMLEPWYKHDYLFEGDCYRLRTGQARRWQVWLDIDGDGAALAACANYPLVPAADPIQAMATGLWGDILPADAPGMADYDVWAANLFAAYQKAIADGRDYGAMNWGDWFGERICNWGNHEYDTPRQFMVQFARTGDPRYFHIGDTSVRHVSEVDVVHFVNADLKNYFEKETPARKGCITEPGLVHEHSVGHVGGFHSVETIRQLYVKLCLGKTDHPYLCIDPYNLGHVFTEGMMYGYFLTGDPWLKETLDKIGTLLAKLVERREFKLSGWNHCGRENGWTMLALAACYEVEYNERYLNAMKTLAEDALGEQDPNCGGWLYVLGEGHCDCETQKHVGEAAFIGAVRLNGLYRYYRLSGDERVPEAIKRGVTHMNHDTWNEKEAGWRYTSCPGTYKSISRPGVTIKAVAGDIRLTDDEEHIRILRKAWAALFEHLKAAPSNRPDIGKALSEMLYGCPETASLLAERSGLEGPSATP